MGRALTGRIVSVMAAVLLVTSCSSDDGGDTDAVDTSTTAADATAADDAPEGDEPAGEGGEDEEGEGEGEEDEPAEAGAAPSWSYDETAANGPDSWYELPDDDAWAACETERPDAHQSPIDIDTAAAVEATDEVLPDIAFDYHDSPLTIFDNGHTVQAAYGGDVNSTIVVDGSTFRLAQFHFHAASEHTIDGDDGDLEIHFVHAEVLPGEEGATTTTAAPPEAPRRLAVIGVVIDEGEANPAYADVMAHIPTTVTHTAEEIAEVGPTPDVTISAEAMLPAGRDFYHYTGSLTTPGCAEVVAWYVMQDRIELSSDQIDAFTARYSANRRPTQPLNDREVATSG